MTMQEFFSNYPPNDEIFEMIREANKDPLKNVLNGTAHIAVNEKDDSKNTPNQIKARLCVLLNTGHRIPIRQAPFHWIMEKIFELSKLFQGKDIIQNSIRFSKEFSQLYGEETEKITSVIFLVFARAHYEELLETGQIHQTWCSASIAVDIAMGRTTEWKELNKMYNPLYSSLNQ